MALLLIPCVQKYKEKNLRAHESFSNVLLHISCVLKTSGINFRERGFLGTFLLDAYWNTHPTTEVYFSVYIKICPITFLNELIIFMPLTSGEGQILYT